MTGTRRWIGAPALLCAAAALGAPSADERGAPASRAPLPSAVPQESVRGGEFVPYPRSGDGPRLRAIRRGLDWLATRQESSDGSVLVDDAEAAQRAPVAVTAFAALAWMAGGSGPTRGPHQDNVRRAIEYLLACVHSSTDKHPGYIEDRGERTSRTHGHGLATLALAQAYTVSPRSPLGKRIGKALEAAVQRIEISQGAEGGWEYEPYRTLGHEGSVTVCLVQALRAAKNAGVRVDSEVIKRAVAYVERLQVMEISGQGSPGGRLGGFRYKLGDAQVSVALTAAALSTLHASGVYDGPRVAEGYDYVWRELLLRQDDPTEHSAAFPYYERFYLSQALWQHRETEHFRRWAEPLMDEIVGAQDESGRWRDERFIQGSRIVNRYGAAYATACNVLFLALPDDTLPIFHR